MKSNKPPFKLPLIIEGQEEEACVRDADGNYIIAACDWKDLKTGKEKHLPTLEYIVGLVNAN